MPDNTQGQMQTPELPQADGEVGSEKPTELSEVVGKSAVSQPVKPADDQAAAQNIANTLQNTQTRATSNVVPPANPTPQATPKTASSDPYIKAAENVMKKDQQDPYKEEEDHEDVQIKYLHDRFGKDIKKG